MARERVDEIASKIQRGISSKVPSKDRRLGAGYKVATAITVAGAVFIAGMVEGSKTSAQVNKETTDTFQNGPEPISEILPESLNTFENQELQGSIDKVKAYFDPAVTYWADNGSMSRWSEQYGVDPLDIATLMQIESCGNPDAKSPAGARGLFQVMPVYHLPAGHTLEEMYDPDFNASLGLSYFSRIAEKTGDLGRTYMVYNGGTKYYDPTVFPVVGSETWKMWQFSGMRVQADRQDGRGIIDWYYTENKRLAGCLAVREKLGL